MSEDARTGFPSPFGEPASPACEGWEELYPRHASFREDRRAFDESRFWFHDGVHFAEPVYPFDAVVLDYYTAALNQMSARLPKTQTYDRRSPESVTEAG
jgi:pyruvate,water dikinase